MTHESLLPRCRARASVDPPLDESGLSTQDTDVVLKPSNYAIGANSGSAFFRSAQW